MYSPKFSNCLSTFALKNSKAFLRTSDSCVELDRHNGDIQMAKAAAKKAPAKKAAAKKPAKKAAKKK